MAVSSPTTAIDLSRLPAPSFLAVPAYEDILAEIIAYLQQPDVLPSFDATVDSDPAVKILQVLAYRELLKTKAVNDNALKIMLAYATGGDLDQIGARLNVARLLLDPGDPAQGINPVYEKDDPFRERIQLAPESFTVAGPEAAYVYHARSADASIRDASASEGEPGQVIVSILSSLGDGTADDDQLAAVRGVLGVVSGNKVRPLGDEVIVRSAEIVPFTIRAELTLFSGPDEAIVLASAQAGADAWLAKSGSLGAASVRAAISAAMFVDGVQNVNLIEPPADVAVDKTQSAHCVGFSVTVAGRGE